MKHLYIIAGANGAGKTTASYTVLPDLLECREFVNADEIARGLSPFNPASVNFTAGRLMIERMHELLHEGVDFGIETTLSSSSLVQFVKLAKRKRYNVTLVFFWLNSEQLAINRVAQRVKEGGHDIPKEVIRRRYHRGLRNFFTEFSVLVHEWIIVDNSGRPYQMITHHRRNRTVIEKPDIWTALKAQYSAK